MWSTGGVFIKYVPADPLFIAAMRAAIAGLVFLPFIRPKSLKLSWALLGLLASYSLMNATFVTATKWTTAANAIALQYTAPLWIFAAQVTLRILKPTPRRMMPMLLVVGGIVLFLLEPSQGTSLKGNLLAVISGIGFGMITVFLRKLRDLPGVTLICLCNLTSALLLLPFIRGWDGVMAIDISGWLGLFYLGAIQIGLGYVLYSKGLESVSSLRAATIALIEPVLNPIWVFLILAEVPSVYGICGALAVLAGVLVDLVLNREDLSANNNEESAKRSNAPPRP